MDNDYTLRKLTGFRLKEIRHSKKMSLHQFYGPISKHVNNFSAVENGNRPIGQKLLSELIRLHNINPDYIESGTGIQFRTSGAQPIEASVPGVKQNGIPFYNINPAEFAAVEFAFERLKAEYYIDFAPFNDCDVWLPVFGDRMSPLYDAGDMVAIKEIGLSELFLWGEAYLIIAGNQAAPVMTLRLLYPHENSNSLIIRCANPNFVGDTVLAKKTIKRIFLIKGRASRKQW